MKINFAAVTNAIFPQLNQLSWILASHNINISSTATSLSIQRLYLFLTRHFFARNLYLNTWFIAEDFASTFVDYHILRNSACVIPRHTAQGMTLLWVFNIIVVLGGLGSVNPKPCSLILQSLGFAIVAPPPSRWVWGRVWRLLCDTHPWLSTPVMLAP